jgi:hypothetical protein
MRTQLAVVLAAIGCTGMAQAAEKIRYEEIPRRIAPFGTTVEAFRVKVIALDGAESAGRGLTFEPNRLRVWSGYSSWDLPRDMVARIEIKRGGWFYRITFSSIVFAFGGPGWACEDNPGPTPLCLAYTSAVISPAAIAFAAASAPATLTVDGVRLLIPPKVYEIVR